MKITYNTIEINVQRPNKLLKIGSPLPPSKNLLNKVNHFMLTKSTLLTSFRQSVVQFE